MNTTYYLDIENFDLDLKRTERQWSQAEAIAAAKAWVAKHPLTTVTGYLGGDAQPVFFISRVQDLRFR